MIETWQNPRRWVSFHVQVNDSPARHWVKPPFAKRFERTFPSGFYGNSYQTENHRVLRVGPLVFEFLVCAAWTGWP